MTESFLFWFGIITGTIGTIAAVRQLLDSELRPTLRVAISVVVVTFAFGLVAWSFSEPSTEIGVGQPVGVVTAGPASNSPPRQHRDPSITLQEEESGEIILSQHLELEKDASYRAVYETDGSFKLVKESPPVRTFTTTIEGFRVQIGNVVYDLNYKIFTASNDSERERINLAQRWRDELFRSISAGVAPKRHLIQGEFNSTGSDIWTISLRWGFE